MYLTATVSDITVGQASVYAVLGYGVVFFGLILLMLVVVLLGKAFIAAACRNQKTQAPVAKPAEPATPVVAPGAAGQLKLYNVEPKTAAMLMAITAYKMGKPLNELRFLSIREVSQ